MRRRRLPLPAVALLAASLLLACGGEGDRDRLADRLVDQTGGALDDEQATCVAEGLERSFGDDGDGGFDELLAAAAGDDAGGEVRTEVIDIFAGCDALDAIVAD